MINPIWRGRFLIGGVLIPLRPGDPWIPVIQAALRTHRAVDTAARRILHAMRRFTARLR
jgi:hypothetical protein